ncbi:chitobiase/beta-hexosaminidase C-terminal domain-containing protein [Candidatus Daviesbacteria bacterium]|nr:chitobiase/beta-hexosaminidase C-terminal domain-containing protein [Candidatus Daviesbacteria bacterium]
MFIASTSEAVGSAALDQTFPTTSIQISGAKDSSGIYTGPVTITLTGNDTQSGILTIEYSLDNGKTVHVYSGPFTISTPGKTTIQFKSIDKLGNEEIPQTITIEIAVPLIPISTPTPTITSGNSSSSSSSNINSPGASTNFTTTNTPKVGFDSFGVEGSILSPPAVLGVTFPNPGHISDEINVSQILNKSENPVVSKTSASSTEQILDGLLIISAGIVTLASLGLIFTFIKPIPE